MRIGTVFLALAVLVTLTFTASAGFTPVPGFEPPALSATSWRARTTPVGDPAAMVLVGSALIGLAACVRRLNRA